MTRDVRQSRLSDTATGYGWISIALHWVTAVVVVALLFIGSSIAGAEPQDRQAVVLLHTSIAVSAYAVLWYRVIWRFAKGHPEALPRQPRAFFLLGKYTHFVMLAAMACMLVSGPLMVWSQGAAIGVFDWFAIPSPFPASYAAHDALHLVHRTAATVIAIGFVLHLGGVYKHAAFDQDGTFGKMLIPAARDDAAQPVPAGAVATTVPKLTIPRTTERVEQ